MNTMNRHKRIIAVHDISCVGRCSLAVALPIISACGIECSILPTVVLSTHTGGFTGFTFRDLTDDIVPITKHWQSLDLDVDAIYTGFLGTTEQIRLIIDLIQTFRKEEGIVLVDPVMADHGKLYSIFDMTYVEEMKKLACNADIIIPNITEACLLTGIEYCDVPYKKEYIEKLLEELSKLGNKNIVLKGVTLDHDSLGVVTYDCGSREINYILGEKQLGMYHGTGDIYGSMLLSSLVNGHSLVESARFAVDYVIDCIRQNRTKDIKYGVDFENPLAEYAIKVKTAK